MACSLQNFGDLETLRNPQRCVFKVFKWTTPPLANIPFYFILFYFLNEVLSSPSCPQTYCLVSDDLITLNLWSSCLAFASAGSLSCPTALHRPHCMPSLMCCFDAGSRSGAYAGLQLTAILLPWLPECWDFKCESPCLATRKLQKAL